MPSELLAAIVGGVATVAAAAIALWGAISMYFRQKEHELVQKRYLEEGIDVVIATAEAALNIYSHNWARCAEILKSFRDLQGIRPEELSTGFLPLVSSRFALTAHYRLNVVVASPEIWECFQLVLSFVQVSNAVLCEEIPLAMKAQLSGQVQATREEIVEAGLATLKDLDERSHRYHIVPAELHRIARLLEEQRFRLKGIAKLRHHEVVVDVVARLKDTFEDKLSANRKAEL